MLELEGPQSITHKPIHVTSATALDRKISLHGANVSRTIYKKGEKIHSKEVVLMSAAVVPRHGEGLGTFVVANSIVPIKEREAWYLRASEYLCMLSRTNIQLIKQNFMREKGYRTSSCTSGFQCCIQLDWKKARK
eukprot:TRINITY_DN10315_c0_g1_i2.p1 TRINITY_DN10315_c0_g1~~TRINITY_DN10315_c0_g1_i2.p1  ORF type:complete len:135 (-),score=0.12 TRINITY_DN10315_c0_g1_i2:300-704(-)